MQGTLRIVFAAMLVLVLPASAAEPHRISDPDKVCEEILHDMSNRALHEAVDLIANSLGRPQAATNLAQALQVLEGKNFDFIRKVVDKDYNGGLRQIVYHAYVESMGFIIVTFGSILRCLAAAGFWRTYAWKDESSELLPTDFVDR